MSGRSRRARCARFASFLTVLAGCLATATRAEALPHGLLPPSMSTAIVFHPMHTSLTVLTHAADGTVTATIRAFADDLSAVIGRDSAHASAPLNARDETRLAAYVNERFFIVGRDGRRLSLRWCGVKRTADLLWLCVSVPSVSTLSGATVMNGVLLERFPDQVNIVQAQYAGRRQSMLFSRAEAPKRLQ